MSHLEIFVLGCTGGPFESNLSSYALVDTKNSYGILLDAGSVLVGLQSLEKKGHLAPFLKGPKEFVPARQFLQEYIKAVLISHVHLDHILGLVLASQIDVSKPILGLSIMLENLRDHIFNGKIWANLGSEGKDARGLYQYIRLNLHQKTRIEGTSLTVEPFLLNHSPTMPSTAFLLENEGDYVLYFGDTSSDCIETEARNEMVWKNVAPLIRENKIKTLLIECSYPNSQEVLFGHLNPKLLHWELGRLREISGCSLSGLKVIITHRKQSTRSEIVSQEIVAQELLEGNHLGVDYIFPKQGDRIRL